MATVAHLASRLTGYERHKQLRTDRVLAPKEAAQSFSELKEKAKSQNYAEQNRHRIIELYQEFAIGHIEFDDQGAFWDREQLLCLRKFLASKKLKDETRGVLLVVFVHGWNHNARYDDATLNAFREVLFDLSTTEQELADEFDWKPRLVAGVYASWRGLSTRAVPARELTFWSRKATAHRVGRGSLAEALIWLEKLRYEVACPFQSRMITIGHSFGAAAVFSAVRHYLKTVAMARWAEAKLRGEPGIGEIVGLGDGIVLVNPAFEAMLYADFDHLLREIRNYDPRQRVVLLTLSAKTDLATRLAFPLGQFAGTCFQRTQTGERARILSACGNFQNYVTHVLTPRDGATGNLPCNDPKAEFQRWERPSWKEANKAAWLSYVPASRRWQIEDRRSLPAGHPFMLVKCDDRLIRGHSGIYQTFLIEFLRDFLIAQDLRAQAVESAERKNCYQNGETTDGAGGRRLPSRRGI